MNGSPLLDGLSNPGAYFDVASCVVNSDNTLASARCIYTCLYNILQPARAVELTVFESKRS